MNSGENRFLEHRGSTIPKSNLSQTGSKFLACVKTEPGCFNLNLLPNSNVYVGNEPGSSTMSHSNSSRQIQIKAEPIEDISSSTIRNNFKNKNKKLRKRNADSLSDDDMKEQKRMYNIKPSPKLEPGDTKINQESYNYKSTAFIGHTCGLIQNKLLFVRAKGKKHEGREYVNVIPDLVNVHLPPCYINSVPARKSFSYNLKSFEWENLVEHELISKIDNNMKRIVDLVLVPGEKYERIRDEIIADLCDVFSEEKLKKLWHCFGSYLHGIVYSDTSIDIRFESPPFEHVLQELYNKLKKSSRFLKPLKQKGHPNLEKPCIQIRHKKTKKNINISFSSALKVECSRVMKFYLGMNPNLKYLAVYLEIILRKYRIRNKHAGIFPPYCSFWLVVFFMQQKNLLPAVIDVREAAEMKRHVSGWDCSLPEDYSYPTESVSLYSLLLGFFDFYKDFNFLNYVICPYLGHVIALSDIENLDLCANKWSTYLRQIQSGDQIQFTRNFLNLQDPTDLSCNLGGDVFQCMDLNMFVAMCRRLSCSLPKEMAEFNKIDCVCLILLDSIDQANYNPYNFPRYENFVVYRKYLNEVCGEKLNQCYFWEAIRKLMEFVFKLEPVNVAVSQNFKLFKLHYPSESVISRSLPIMHFEYCSSENTWQSDYMKEIIPEKEPVQIYLRCEIDLIKQHRVHIYAQGEARFIGFLRGNFRNMLVSVLNQIILP